MTIDRDIYLSSLSSRVQRMVNASPDPRAAVKEFQETLFEESLVSEVPYCPTEEAGTNLILSNSRVWDVLSNMGVFRKMPAKALPVTNLMAHEALMLDLDDPVGRLKSWAGRMAREA
jgi:hypothetical protein